MKLPKSSEAMIEARNKAMQEGLKTAVKTFKFKLYFLCGVQIFFFSDSCSNVPRSQD